MKTGYLDVNILNEYYNKGLLYKQTHNIYDLIVWNYTQKVQYEGLWDDVSKNCRGLITNSKGKIVSRCIPKFWNMEELNPNDIPNEPFEAFMKMDGSYISLFFYENEWIFASRGSFNSDQAVLAKKVFNKKYADVVNLDKNINMIFELVGPDNRIVVSYPKNDLVLLTSYDALSGEELNIYSDGFNGFTRVKKYDGINDYRAIKESISDDEEGMVVRFINSGMRMKIKGANYVILHRIITNVSSLTIWEHLSKNEDLEKLLLNVPDEWFQWVRKTADSLNSRYSEIEKQALEEYQRIMNMYTNISKKWFAQEAKKSNLRAILFKQYDGKPYSEIIWKMIRPEFIKPFHDGYDCEI
jgi:RNA ligase